MWRENLPDNCPPTDAVEVNVEVYRILAANPHTDDDFLPHVKRYPDNPRYKDLCEAYAVSFFDTYDNARNKHAERLEKGSNMGSFLARYTLTNQDGRATYRQASGHYNVWFYQVWNLEGFTLIDIEQIGAN